MFVRELSPDVSAREASAMRLLTAEVGRVLSRRTVLVLLLVAVGLAVVLGGAAAYDTRPLSGTEIDAAQEAVSQDAAAYDEERARCLEDPVATLGDESDRGELRPATPHPRPVPHPHPARPHCRGRRPRAPC